MSCGGEHTEYIDKGRGKKEKWDLLHQTTYPTTPHPFPSHLQMPVHPRQPLQRIHIQPSNPLIHKPLPLLPPRRIPQPRHQPLLPRTLHPLQRCLIQRHLPIKLGARIERITRVEVREVAIQHRVHENRAPGVRHVGEGFGDRGWLGTADVSAGVT